MFIICSSLFAKQIELIYKIFHLTSLQLICNILLSVPSNRYLENEKYKKNYLVQAFSIKCIPTLKDSLKCHPNIKEIMTRRLNHLSILVGTLTFKLTWKTIQLSYLTITKDNSPMLTPFNFKRTQWKYYNIY